MILTKCNGTVGQNGGEMLVHFKAEVARSKDYVNQVGMSCFSIHILR